MWHPSSKENVSRGKYSLLSLTSGASPVRRCFWVHAGGGSHQERQPGLTKGTSCLTHPIVFCDKMTRYADNGRAIDVTYLDSRKVLTLSPILLSNWNITAREGGQADG